MKRTIVAATLASSAIMGAGAASALTSGEQTVAEQPQLVTRGAILMLNKPHIHENTAHTSVGHPVVNLIPGQGRSHCLAEVSFDQNPGEKIVNISATPDDKMVKQGITVGTAGGNGRVSIRLYQNGKAICANDSRIDPAANVWLQTTVLQTN